MLQIMDENREMSGLYVENTNPVANDGWYFVKDGSTGTRVTTALTRSELTAWLRHSGLELAR